MRKFLLSNLIATILHVLCGCVLFLFAGCALQELVVSTSQPASEVSAIILVVGIIFGLYMVLYPVFVYTSEYNIQNYENYLLQLRIQGRGDTSWETDSGGPANYDEDDLDGDGRGDDSLRRTGIIQ